MFFVEVLYGTALDRGFCHQDTHQPNYRLTDPPIVTEEKWIKAERQARPEDGR